MKPIRWDLLAVGKNSKLRRLLEQKADQRYEQWKKEHNYRTRRERNFLGVYYVEETNEQVTE